MRRLALFCCLAVAASVSVPSSAAVARQKLVFVAYSARLENKGIFTMNPDGSGRKRIYDEPAYGPTWSPDRSKIAFYWERCETRNECEGHIFVMEPDGSNVRQLPGDHYSIGGFDWAPDSERIVYSAFDEERTDYDLFITAEGEEGPTRLTDTTLAYETSPDWSPDGSTIVFDRSGDMVEDIFAIAPDGTNERNLTNDEHYDSFPTWSPDGSKIAFVNSRDDRSEGEDAPYTNQLFVMDPDGVNVTRISRNEKTIKSGPQWSRDSEKLAWTEDCDMDYCAKDAEIWVSDAAGERPRNLTDNKLMNDHSPQWSADGRRLVFARWRRSSARTDIFSISARGGSTRRLTDTKGPEDPSDWQSW